jgi:hypothetical protein
MGTSHEIASKLEDCLEAGYFDQSIRNIYTLLNHIQFLEKQVTSLKGTIARLQAESPEKSPEQSPLTESI